MSFGLGSTKGGAVVRTVASGQESPRIVLVVKHDLPVSAWVPR